MSYASLCLYFLTFLSNKHQLLYIIPNKNYHINSIPIYNSFPPKLSFSLSSPASYKNAEQKPFL